MNHGKRLSRGQKVEGLTFLWALAFQDKQNKIIESGLIAIQGSGHQMLNFFTPNSILSFLESTRPAFSTYHPIYIGP